MRVVRRFLGSPSSAGRAAVRSWAARRARPSRRRRRARPRPRTGVVVVNTNLAFGDGAAAGTGIVLTSSGDVLTNNHVDPRRDDDPRHGRPRRQLTFGATVLGYSVSKDVALLQLKNPRGLHAGDDRQLVVGRGRAGDHRGRQRRRHRLADDGHRPRHRTRPVDHGQRRPGRLEPPDRHDRDERAAPARRLRRPAARRRPRGRDRRRRRTDRRREPYGEGFAIPIYTAMLGRPPGAQAGHQLAPCTSDRRRSSASCSTARAARHPGALDPGRGPRLGSRHGRDRRRRHDRRAGGHAITSATELQHVVLQIARASRSGLSWVDGFQATRSAIVRPAAGPPQ